MKNHPILHHDDEYILITKRRFLAGNIAMASMAKHISAIQNCSMPEVVKKFAQFGVNEAELMPQDVIDKHIQNVIEAAKNA